MADCSVTLCSLELSNPVIPASGTFAYGHEFAEYYDINILGALAVKGTTKDKRFGNPTPRTAECTAGLINSVGLQNPGIDEVLAVELPMLKRVYNKPVIVNVSGFSVEDYVFCCEKLDNDPGVDMIEINISCPNVHCGGMTFGSDPKNAAKVTKAAKRVSSKPVFVKLTPNVTDITEIARACEAAGADGLTLINTLLGMRIDPRAKRPVTAAAVGGFSGPAIFPVALCCVYRVFKSVNIPLMGCGGVQSARDVIEMMLAGASAVQVGSANLINPFACKEIIEALPAEAEKYGITDLKDIIGGAHV